MSDLKLTGVEIKAILAMRQKEEGAKRKRSRTLELLETATRFEAFLQGEGMGATYSTFCDDFGYEAGKGERRNTTYESVMSIIAFAKRHAEIRG